MPGRSVPFPCSFAMVLLINFVCYSALEVQALYLTEFDLFFIYSSHDVSATVDLSSIEVKLKGKTLKG